MADILGPYISLINKPSLVIDLLHFKGKVVFTTL